MNWICSQYGAREHYAIPRALSQSGKTVELFTDFYAGNLIRRIEGISRNRLLRAATGRFHDELSTVPIKSWNWRALSWELEQRKSSNSYEGFAAVGHKYSKTVSSHLKRHRTLDSNVAVFSYDTAALEVFEHCKESGTNCVLGQMDPNRFESALVHLEEQQWPDWVGKKQSIPEHYYARREEEWALADKIVVNSEFSRKALIHQNVAPEKIAVIPLAYEAPQYQPLPSNPVEPTTRPLRVLWLGQVNLRKGIQYLCSAAKLLKGSQIQIDVVGPVYISEQAMKSAPENVVFHGSVPRSEIAEWYRQADVFVLPTISDGFAITQLEAMAHGLPVISTPNCGEVVSNGRDGLIVPAGNAEAIAIALDSLSSDRPLLRKMSHQATKTVRRFSIANLIQNLESLEQNLIRPTSQPKSAGSHEILP